MTLPRDNNERILANELTIASIVGRLKEGAETFAEMKRHQRWPVMALLGMAAAVAVFVGGLIWQAAKYPDMSEIRSIKMQQQGLLLDLQQTRSDVREINKSIDRTELAVGEIKMHIQKLSEQSKQPSRIRR